MENDRFEWDDNKAESNLAKHLISFAFALRVFQDENAIDLDDSRFDYDEFRCSTVGIVEDVMITVSHTIRGEKIRLISARRSSPQEARQYHEGR
jgi:uncharacterized protein